MGSFLNPFMLWGMLAVSVPIVIHLLSRRRYRKVPWAAMEFLLIAYKRTRRRLRLENLLLLLLRCLLPILFALAAARPFLTSDSPLSSLAEESRDVILIADESYSMARRLGSSSAMDAQRSQLKKLLASLDYESGNAATVMTLASDPRLISSRLRSPEQHQSDIDSRMPAVSLKKADLLVTLQYLRDQVAPKIPGAKDVFIFSDFQKDTFLPSVEDDLEELEGGPVAVMKSLQSVETRFFFVDVLQGDPPTENLTVRSLEILERTPMTKQSVTFVATLKNNGTVAVDATGKFLLGGEPFQSITERLEPGQEVNVEATQVFQEEGFYGVEFRLDEDDLGVDDTRFVTFEVRERIPILLVDGDWNQDPWLRETGQMDLMLDPIGDAASGALSPFSTRVVDIHELNRGRVYLDDYELVVLANLEEIDEDVVASLENYVRAGAGLLMFVGDKVNARSYNARMHDPAAPCLLPFPLGDVIGSDPQEATRFFGFQVTDFEHPVFRPFADPTMMPLISEPPTSRFYRLDPVERQDVNVLATWNDDPNNPSPAVLETRLEEGRIVVVSTTADSAWSLFPETPGFLAFLHELGFHLTIKDLDRYNLAVGETIVRSFSSVPRSVSVTRPSGERVSVDKVPEEKVGGRYPLDLRDVELNVPGVYGLDVTESGTAADERLIQELYAVNVDPKEGDLTRASESELLSVYGDVISETLTDVSEVVEAESESQQGEIFKAILIALIVLCVSESILAFLFGKRQ